MNAAQQALATRSDLRRPATSFAMCCVSAAIGWIALRAEIARQRRALAKLDDRLLRDVGLTRDDVAQETGKPFRYR